MTRWEPCRIEVWRGDWFCYHRDRLRNVRLVDVTPDKYIYAAERRVLVPWAVMVNPPENSL